jgi:hypothetical protein
MAILPRKDSDLLNWVSSRSELWQENAAFLNFTTAQITAWQALINEAQVANQAAEQACNASKAATSALRDSIRTLRRETGELIDQVRLTADRAENPVKVYNRAQVPEPTPPSPRPAPEAPRDLSATLDASTGDLKLTWKASGNSGTVYTIRRRVTTSTGTTASEVVGVTGSKRFTDDDVPTGARSVQYTVQGARGRSIGPESAILTIAFGRGGGETTIRSQKTLDNGARLAA